MTFKVTIEKRSSSGKVSGANRATSSIFPLTLELPTDNPTVSNLKAAIHAKVSLLHPWRQRLTTVDKKPLLSDDKTLESEGVRPGDVLQVKDLGPQVAWRTVFLVEYLGPLLIHPLFYFFGDVIFRRRFEHSQVQQIAFLMVMAHYIKRELETIFVHRFSNGSMPIFNIFKNSTHYWVLSGVLLSAGIYGPWMSAPALAGTLRAQDTFLYSCAAVWTFAELSNLQTHIMLKNLRRPGTRERKIPRGFAFELISCPNYFFETVAWVAFTVMTLSPAAALFAVVSTAQMMAWALKKQRAYRKEFDGKEGRELYPRARKAMIPFLL